jgi:nitrite reductase (NO-forming)
LIGEIFDKVQQEGGTHPQENVQTTLIPAGGAVTVEFHTEVPGNYILVDHSIFRAFNKGALAILEVSGDLRADIYSGKQVDETYLGDKVANMAPVTAAAAASAAGNSHERAADQGGRGTVQGHLLHLPSGNRQGNSQRVPAARRLGLSTEKTGARDRDRAQRPERTGHGERQHLHLGDAANEPAQRR